MSKYIEVEIGSGGVTEKVYRTGIQQIVSCTETHNPSSTNYLYTITDGNNNLYYTAVLKGQQRPVLNVGDVVVLERLVYDGDVGDDFHPPDTRYGYWLLITDEDE